MPIINLAELVAENAHGGVSHPLHPRRSPWRSHHLQHLEDHQDWIMGVDGDDPYADPSSIAHILDFSPGHQIRAKVRHLFAISVNPVSRSHHFFLVVSFGRTSFRLSDQNAGLALSACLGFAYDEIEIVNLRDRVFQFAISCKAVGFFVHRLRSYSCRYFKCYFHLWGFGGPNWIREESLY